ncbi:hypothetical protein BJ912DRAFT_859710 [Pholiota molesta]|nr:hypothetical protein BJ912DRAFT_859710 [Pholiota molesta]
MYYFTHECIFRAGKNCAKKDTIVLSDTSTMRRHMEYLHSDVYRRWAKDNHFISMLPKDSSARRAAERDSLKQTAVNDHFSVQKPNEKPIIYSDELFKEAAIQWLVETDQPIQALKHHSFQHMIRVAERATRPVKIPNPEQTRAGIINTFRNQMKALRDRLNVRISKLVLRTLARN